MIMPRLVHFNEIDIFEQIKPALAAMDDRRSAVLEKFRPIMAIFGFYGFFCLIFPFASFGVAYDVKGSLFSFLVIVGLMAFSIVIITYRQQYLSLEKTLSKELSRLINNRVNWTGSEKAVAENEIKFHPNGNDWRIADFWEDISCPGNHGAISYFLEIHRNSSKSPWKPSSLGGVYFHFDLNINPNDAFQMIPEKTPIEVFLSEGFETISIPTLNPRFKTLTKSKESALLSGEVVRHFQDLCNELKVIGLSKYDLHAQIQGSSLYVMMIEDHSIKNLLQKRWSNPEFVYLRLIAMDQLLSFCTLIENQNQRVIKS